MKTHYSIQQYSMISKEGSANFMTKTFMLVYNVNQHKGNFQQKKTTTGIQQM